MSRIKLLDAIMAPRNARDESEASVTAREQIREEAKLATSVLVDNVAKYYFEGTDQEEWNDFEDFPNLAPPFPAMWFEYSPTGRIVSCETGVTEDHTMREIRWGFLVRSDDVDLAAVDGRDIKKRVIEQADMFSRSFGKGVGQDLVDLIRVANHADLEALVKRELVAKKARWMTDVLVFMSLGDVPLCDGLPIAGLRYNVDPSGGLVPIVDKGTGGLAGGPTNEYVQWVKKYQPDVAEMFADQRGMEQWVRLTQIAYHVVMLSISFMHCNKVKIVQSGVRSNVSANKKKNRHKPPPSGVRYHVLEIEPLKEILRSISKKTGSRESDYRQALNIHRGHFKTYGRPVLDEHGNQIIKPDGTPLTTPGLFGREDLKGMYWWPSHVRGTKDRGVVKKDYEVNL